MAQVDASTLGDATAIRRTVLAERHDQALRSLRFHQGGGAEGVVDAKALDDAQKALDAVTAEIQAEYAEGAEPPKGK